MAKKQAAERLPDLREFIKENDQRLYDFCIYMMQGSVPVDDFVVEVFRDFAQEFRRLVQHQQDPQALRVGLFRFTWHEMGKALELSIYQPMMGRDTRSLKNFDEDLLSASSKGKHPKWEDLVVERLSRVDVDFRAPMVLKDILGFTDDEVLQILGLRWGVFRHRLHRGRTDFKDALHGWPISPVGGGKREAAWH